MNNKKKKNYKEWLSNIYSICTVVTLFFIMAQAVLARRAIIQSSEWEKAKITIDNVEHFKEKLKETALYGQTDLLIFSDRLWPDFSKPENWEKTEILRNRYYLLFNDGVKWREDEEKSIAIFNAFAYPVIMGYASEIDSYESVILEFNSYGNIVMITAFQGYPKIVPHAKLLYKLWRIRDEQRMIKSMDLNDNEYVKFLTENINNLLCFEGTEFTPATLKRYEKKLEKELKKVQKEIEVFRKSRLQ